MTQVHTGYSLAFGFNPPIRICNQSYNFLPAKGRCWHQSVSATRLRRYSFAVSRDVRRRIPPPVRTTPAPTRLSTGKGRCKHPHHPSAPLPLTRVGYLGEAPWEG